MTSHALAEEALAWIWLLYDIEDRLADATPEVRKQVRMRESVPILERLHEQLVEARPTVRPSSKLVRGDWVRAEPLGGDDPIYDRRPIRDRQQRGRTDPFVPSVIGRKNYEFFGSDRGGEAGCIWYTLIQSARHNHVCAVALSA